MKYNKESLPSIKFYNMHWILDITLLTRIQYLKKNKKNKKNQKIIFKIL